jgi:hypothetical protein
METTELKQQIQDMCEFLKSVEEINPIPSHENLFNKWEDFVWEMWDSQKEEFVEEEQLDKYEEILTELLNMRKELHKDEMKKSALRSEEIDNSWEWLLNTKQVEQRTNAWVAEAQTLLTASEIGALWKGPGTRAALVRKKASPPSPYLPPMAVSRNSTSAMDWGVRYEPIVKQIMEKKYNIKIIDLGRIRHKTIERLGASPDGLIVEVNGEENKELLGSLIEIKCPRSRIINDDVPFEYWCQMQLQMEICERPYCEYIEAKFKEVEAFDPEAEGWITMEANPDTLQYKYVYHDNLIDTQKESGWVKLEVYGWKLETLRVITQKRDKSWFQGIQKDLEAFWKDVELCKEGKWEGPIVRKRVRETKSESYSFVDDENDDNQNKTINLDKDIPEPH